MYRAGCRDEINFDFKLDWQEICFPGINGWPEWLKSYLNLGGFESAIKFCQILYYDMCRNNDKQGFFHVFAAYKYLLRSKTYKHLTDIYGMVC